MDLIALQHLISLTLGRALALSRSVGREYDASTSKSVVFESASKRNLDTLFERHGIEICLSRNYNVLCYLMYSIWTPLHL